jgi:hypothetical protein
VVAAFLDPDPRSGAQHPQKRLSSATAVDSPIDRSGH